MVDIKIIFLKLYVDIVMIENYNDNNNSKG